MASPVTIPLIGLLKAKVGLSPLQFSGANPNLVGPVLITTNGMGQSNAQVLGDNAGGFYGLKGIYTSIPPWKGNGGGLDTMVQFAGFTINSFGVFDLDMTMPNPSLYHPVATNYGGYPSQYIGQNSAFSRYNYSIITGNQFIRLKTLFPSLLFSSLKTAFQYSAAKSYTQQSLNYEVNAGFVAIDQVTRAEKPLGFRLYNVVSGGTPHILGGMYVDPDGNPTPPGPYSPAILSFNADQRAVLSVPSGATGGFSGLYTASVCTNPSTGNCIFNLQNGSAPNPPYNVEPGAGSGFSYCNVFFQPGLSGTSWTGAAAIKALALSDPTDNAAITGTNGINNYVPVMTPFGYFLLYVANYPYYLMIAGDLSGYYRVQFNGVDTASQVAVNNAGAFGFGTMGFGQDLAGNFWFPGAVTNGIPLLYSTLGLGGNLNFGPFPQLVGNALACRVMGGYAQTVWEG